VKLVALQVTRKVNLLAQRWIILLGVAYCALGRTDNMLRACAFQTNNYVYIDSLSSYRVFSFTSMMPLLPSQVKL
jgi:hypothetical protein